MSYYLSTYSLENLASAHPVWKDIIEDVIEVIDVRVICGHRGREDQDRAYRDGHSTKQWPDSVHNTYPSMAIDVIPCPVDWSNATDNLRRYIMMSGIIRGIGHSHGVKIRAGNDWNMNNQFGDQSFNDYPHHEIIDGIEP